VTAGRQARCLSGPLGVTLLTPQPCCNPPGGPGLWAQPLANLGVDEQLTRYCLEVVRHEDPHLDCHDGSLKDAHVLVGDLVGDARLAQKSFNHRDEGYVVCPDEL